MLPHRESGNGVPALVLMPFLGGSQREWIETIHHLAPSYRCITADLPGFGTAAALRGYSVSDMCDAVIGLLVSLSVDSYVLVGHSMAGKVSAVVTRRLMAPGPPIPPPAGLVLVAPSPPSPEPMTDDKRSEMLQMFPADAAVHGKNALASTAPNARANGEQFVDDNLASALTHEIFARTVDDVLAMNSNAWTAWLEAGSKEDWSEFVGVLDLPVLVVAGSKDAALGPDAQRKVTLPHFSRAELKTLDCSHLVPLEKPAELASLISTFALTL